MSCYGQQLCNYTVITLPQQVIMEMQTSVISKIHHECQFFIHYKVLHFIVSINNVISTTTKLHWFPIKQKIDYKMSSHIQNNYKLISFLSHSVSTRSFDSLVLSIPYVWSSLGKRAFFVIVLWLWNSLPPDTWNSSSLPIFHSKLLSRLCRFAFFIAQVSVPYVNTLWTQAFLSLYAIWCTPSCQDRQ